MVQKFKCKIRNIIKLKEKKMLIIISTLTQEKETPNEYPKKVRTVSSVSKKKTLVTRENPPIQNSIANSLNTSVATINKIVSKD